MGHGASTNVKKVSIHNNGIPAVIEPTRPTRSSSDGCIVETLNSSKTKADLLELQLDELKELLQLTNRKYEESKEKAKLFEQQLAEVEGTNLASGDRVVDLEQQLESLQTDDKPLQEADEQISFLEGQLKDKDESIEKLELQMQTAEADMKKLRSKFKKRLKAVQTEVAEAKQESALKVYSLKDDIKRLEEENTKLIVRLDRASSASKSRQGPAQIPTTKASHQPDNEDDALDGWEDGRTKLIVELSNQMSAQEELVSDLQKQLADKDAIIKELQGSSSSRPTSGKSRIPSAKSDRTQPKGTWGYRGDDVTTGNLDHDGDQQWAPDDPSYEKQDKISYAGGGARKPPTGSQKKLRDTYSVADLEAVVNNHDSRTNHKKPSRKSASSHKKLKGTYTVAELENSVLNKSPRISSADSAISRTPNGDVVAQNRTSSVSSQSSRQRRRLQGMLLESSTLSPRDTDSGLSNTSVLSRTKNIRGGSSASQHSLLSQDLYDG